VKSRCHDLIISSRPPRDSLIFSLLSVYASLSPTKKVTSGPAPTPPGVPTPQPPSRALSHVSSSCLAHKSTRQHIRRCTITYIYISKPILPTPKSFHRALNQKRNEKLTQISHECCASENRFGPSSVPPGSSWFASSLSLPA
jgi:hypothetical protein